jgi:lipoate-protein ligase B
MERLLMGELDSLLASVGASTEVIENATGVWVRAQGEQKASKKIASIGIAVRKWVTYHGLSLNCVNDLKNYQLISPCGFSPEVMTRLADWIPLDSKSWRESLEKSLARSFAEEAMDGVVPVVQTMKISEIKARLDRIEAEARSIAGHV